MALIPLEEPTTKRIPPDTFSLWALAFRPLYLLAAILAAVAIPVWAVAFSGGLELPIPGIWWHAHEMIFGFAVAVIIGFLLTAGRNWTGLDTPTDGLLAMLAALWLAGRLARRLDGFLGQVEAKVGGRIGPMQTQGAHSGTRGGGLKPRAVDRSGVERQMQDHRDGQAREGLHSGDHGQSIGQDWRLRGEKDGPDFGAEGLAIRQQARSQRMLLGRQDLSGGETGKCQGVEIGLRHSP